MAKGLSVLDNADSGCATQSPKLNLAQSNHLLKAGKFKGKAALVTLGCAKNQVDSEVMLGVLMRDGFEVVSDLAEADLAIVNTCGFLKSSVKESIDAVLSVADYKKTGKLRKLIMAGCAVERYGAELAKELPEVDHFVSIDNILKIAEVSERDGENLFAGAERPYFLYDDKMPRHLSTRSHTAFVKISEGCDRPCTFCIIPALRGKLRSRALDSVIREAQQLGEMGVQEINLVAQDATAYGKDLGNLGLLKLLQELDATQAVPWIRLLYAYPIGIDAELLRALVDLPRVCEYLDLPLQHSSQSVLKAMQRPLGRYAPREIVKYIRQIAPELHLRTTFIVGFPGESEKDVDDLESFISEGHFSNVGIFTYSPEDGTPSALMGAQVPENEKKARRAQLMRAQQAVVGKRLESFVGKRLEVLIEGIHDDSELLYVGRTRFQAPEVDGLVIINDAEQGLELCAGKRGQVEITEVSGYDLVGCLKSVNSSINP